ncbi:LPXTG cell wall anchor domain-containing protein, partial [Staphylococcus xylosus]|uniref:LPXTG cell wall anchor domain-containing protein n=1 Tax=Staphylococcus xylosus TaxID=1288 RepID=UPI002076BB17
DPTPEPTPDPEPTSDTEPNIDPSSKDNEIQFPPNNRNNVVKLESQEDTNLNIKAINASTAVKSSQIATDTEAVNSLAKTNTSQHTNEKKQLPNTGEKERSTTMWSSFLLLLGSTLLFFRKKKQEEK